MAVYNKNGIRIDEGVITIKDHFAEEMALTISQVQQINDAPAIVFPVITDVHRYKIDKQTFPDMINNVKFLTKKIKCDFIAVTGDVIEGNQNKSTSIEQALDTNSYFVDTGVPIIYAEGNHDNNPYSGSNSDLFSLSDAFKAFFTPVKGVEYHFSETGTEYYMDIENLNVRVVVLNSCNSSVARSYAYGQATANWLETQALDTNYTVLLFEHVSSVASQVLSNTHGTNADSIESVLRAFVNNGGTLIEISGHSHIDIAFIQPWLSVMNVCQLFEMVNVGSANYNKITGYIDVKSSPSRTADTYTEDAWTVCVLKPQEYELDCIRFGAGVNRYFHYDHRNPETLVTRLSNVTWSSSNTAVATVNSQGVVTAVATGTCAILAKDTTGNYECWIIDVA